MAEYICREALLEHLNKCKEDPLFDADMARICFAISIFIENMKAADVQPVKRGRWIKQEGFWNKNTVKCSLCGNYLDMNGVNGGRSDANYCPNCGARMDGDT